MRKSFLRQGKRMKKLHWIASVLTLGMTLGWSGEVSALAQTRSPDNCVTVSASGYPGWDDPEDAESQGDGAR